MESDSLRTLEAGGERRFHSVATLRRDLALPPERLPRTVILLLEMLLRHRTDPRVTPAELAALVRWPRSGPLEIPFFPSRVLAPDSSGLPLLADLAALRNAAVRRGLPAGSVEPAVPLDLVVDHAIAVDEAGTRTAAAGNLARELERNAGRYRFLRWAEQAFRGLRVVPPGQGILHQINLEQLTPLVVATPRLAFPDSLVGCDSHTPMANGLGILAIGAGGIEALTVLLGEPLTLPLPRLVGCRLTGRPPPGVLATDLALELTARLAALRLEGAWLEFFGPGVAALTAADRCTLANMAPEYGATQALFPQDAATFAFLAATGRSPAVVQLARHYAQAQGLWHEPGAEPAFEELVEFDLGAAARVLAGPSQPCQRLTPQEVPASLPRRASGGGGLDHGSVVLAALTSCTNTANPAAMLAAGLLARNARRRGLEPRAWVKASLSPGSRAVTAYLESFGLLQPLAELGFALAGYGCMTCAGSSGPLAPQVEAAVRAGELEVVAVLSGNRNFPGRIHPLVHSSYLASPPLVVASALAGTLARDLAGAPLAADPQGRPVTLAEIWPDPQELADLASRALTAERFQAFGASLRAGPAGWDALQAPGGLQFPFVAGDLELLEPPFLELAAPAWPDELTAARALLVLGDEVNTDAISPAGSIGADSPAGRYLRGAGVAAGQLDRYITRRTNHEVMLRGTFANPRLVNLLAGGRRGGVTQAPGTAALLPIHEAAARHAAEARPLLILAGRNYGCGSSRDWAAKGTRLLGVRAVIAESFGAIHRANLVGMGVLPLRFAEGCSAAALALAGQEDLDLLGLHAGLAPGGEVTLRIRGPGGSRLVPLRSALMTAAEERRLRAGGILPSVLAGLGNGQPGTATAAQDL